MQVRRYNFRSQFASMPELLKEIETILYAGSYILGSEVSIFEKEFAAFCEVGFTRGVNTGTDALVIAMRALGIGSGDEVITAANTFHATAAAIVLTGARPVLVDACPDTFLMDVDQVPAAVTLRTRAIIPVHLYGKPVDIEPILRIARRAHIDVIEDAAQAHGAITCGKPVGSFGIAGCFSFHPSKNLSAAGDAGAIVTSDAGLANRLDLHRGLGQSGQNNHVLLGLNSKLDALQALILRRKLPYLKGWNEDRGTVAAMYRERLCELPISFQATRPEEVHVYHLFQIRVEQKRDELLSFLQSRGVDAIVRYPVPIHLQPAFAQFGWKRGQFPVAETLADQLLCLPIRPDMTVQEVDFVIAEVRRFYETQYPATHVGFTGAQGNPFGMARL